MSTTRRPKSKSAQSTFHRTPKPIDPNAEFLSRAQAVVFCGGMNVQIIDSAIKRGDLKASKVPGRYLKKKGRYGRPSRVLIRKTDLIAWIEAGKL